MLDIKDIEFKTLEDLSKEELIELIKDIDLKLVKIFEVKQKSFSPYKYTTNDKEQLKVDMRVFDFTIHSEKYKLTTDEEVKYIILEGREKDE